jgi:hypothetical protein
MSAELVKALNRVARAMERSNSEKVQRKLVRARTDELLSALEDKALLKRVADALQGLNPTPTAAVAPNYDALMGPFHGLRSPIPLQPVLNPPGTVDPFPVITVTTGLG